MLEALSFDILVDEGETEDFVGSQAQRVEEVLIKPGWSALRQVSFKITIACCGGNDSELYKALLLQSFPDKYLSHLSRIESVAFNLSASLSEY